MAQKFTTGITVRDLASAASDALAVSVAGDTDDRIKFEAGGKVVWGSGASAGDVNLYRDAANRLKTDDAFQSDGGLITVTTAGTPTLSLPDGALAIDTTNNLLYIRTGGAWEIASGGGASVTTSDNAPSAPEDGDLWYETDTGSMFVYYDDGASQQWVEVGTAGVIAMTTSSTAPTTPANGDLWFDTDTARTYVYYDDGSSQQWVEVGAASAAASGQDGYVQFATGGTFNSASALVWDNTNKRLGVGTSTPAYPLDVTGTARATSFTSQTVGATTSISSSGPLFSGSFAGDYVFINDPSTSGAGGLQATGNVTIGGNLNVDTSTLHVDSANNRVGIGTTTPNNQLQVAGNVYLGNFQNVTPDANGTGHLMIGGAGYVGFASLDGSAMWVGHNSGSRNLFLATNETARVTVTGGGNVGINDTTPSYTLDVNGDINTTGALRTDGKKTGLVLLTSGDVSSGGPITFTSLFSSEFDNYVVYISELTCTGQNAIYYRTASGGSWNTSSVYSNQRIYGQTTSIGAQRFSSTYAQIGYAGARESNYEITFFSPYLSTQTAVISRGAYSDNSNGGYIEFHHSYVDNTTSYDGFVFDEVTGSASISCRYEVYGIPK